MKSLIFPSRDSFHLEDKKVKNLRTWHFLSSNKFILEDIWFIDIFC